MPIMELVVDGQYNGQQVINKYNYVMSGTPVAVTPSFALLSAFGLVPTGGLYPSGAPFGTIRVIQNEGVNYIQAIAKNLYSVTDFYTLPFPAGAHGGGDPVIGAMSPFVAFPFRTNRVRSDIRRGQKRYAGVSEGTVNSFGAISTDALTFLAAHALQLSASLTYDDEGNTLTFVPCILQLKKVVVVGAKPKWEKWPTEAEQLAHIAQGVKWEAMPNVSTQNSRKVGHGS